MYAERRVQISLYDQYREFFEDGAIWTNPFTVYGRQHWTEDFVGVFPWLFIVNADPSPSFKVQHLPVMVIETNLDIHNLELGGAKFGVLKFACHIFAENGAQRDDLCGAILARQSHVIVRDYDQAPPPLIGVYTLIANSQGAVWSASPISYSPFAPEWYSQYTRYGRILSSAIEIVNL